MLKKINEQEYNLSNISEAEVTGGFNVKNHIITNEAIKTEDVNESEYLAANDEIVRKVRERQPADEYLYDLAEFFKVFGDSTRIKILYALFESDLCVGDIAQLLHLSQSAASHQLRILKDAKLVKFRREGKAVFYALDDEHVRNILSMGMEHVEE